MSSPGLPLLSYDSMITPMTRWKLFNEFFVVAIKVVAQWSFFEKKMTSIVAPITVLWLQYYSYDSLINLQQIIDVLIYSLISSIGMNNNICTVQSESSTFASLSFDLGVPKKRPTTAPSDSILHRSNCCLFR